MRDPKKKTYIYITLNEWIRIFIIETINKTKSGFGGYMFFYQIYNMCLQAIAEKILQL